MKPSKYLVFVGMGAELVGIILSCLYIGKTIDERFQLQGIGMALLSLAGLAGWITHIVILARGFDKQDSD